MIYLTALLVACTVGLITLLVAQAIPTRATADVSRRLEELARTGVTPFGAEERVRRRDRRAQWMAILTEFGERVQQRRQDSGEVRLMLIQAGYREPNAVSIYWGARVASTVGMGVLGLLLASSGGGGIFLGVGFMAFGYIAPSFYLGGKIRARKKELQKALPDALDAIVVCVEAGLGLNQAIHRVSEEIGHISALMSEELSMINMEIRAGVQRDEALRNLAERTGVEDIRSLVTMLIQTDRFGTSIAQALRVQSDTLRTKRRQRAEEAAAKTAIKMLFPLVFFIFPALFVAVLGPGILQLIEVFTSGAVKFGQ